MVARKTLYDALQVTANADSEIIRAAYRNLVQRYHPDKNPGNTEAENILKTINRAYDVLSDPTKRAGYDAALAEIDHEEIAQSAPRSNQDTKYSEPADTKNNGSGDSKKANSNVTAENNLVSRPWVRFWAKWVDYFICSLMFAPVLLLVDLPSGFLNFVSSPYGSGMFVAFAWLLIEPVVLALFETTLGRKLFNINLQHESGKKLSQIEFIELYKRAFLVWVKGMACGFPVVNWFTLGIAYLKLKKEGQTSWDRERGFVVTHGEVGSGRWVAAMAVIFVTLVINGIVYSTDHQRLAPVEQSHDMLPFTLPLSSTEFEFPAFAEGELPVILEWQRQNPNASPRPAHHFTIITKPVLGFKEGATIYTLGQSMLAFLASFGPGDFGGTQRREYQYDGLSIYERDGKINSVTFYLIKLSEDSPLRPANVKTEEGITTGATRSEIVKIYGKPTSQYEDGLWGPEVMYKYGEEEITFRFINDVLSQIEIGH